MTRSLRSSTSLLLLTLVACQPASDTGGASDVAARLEATNQRLEAIEAKLGAIETKLDASTQPTTTLLEWAQAEKAKDEALTARVAAREARRAELAAKHDELVAQLGEDTTMSVDTEGSSGREIEGAAEAIACEERKSDRMVCVISQAFIDTVLGDPMTLAKQARIVPSHRDGETLGYKLYGIRAGSVPKLLGFKNGDLVTSIDGTRLDSIDQAMDIYSKVRGAKRFAIDIDRRGSPYAIEIEIVK